jgi:hypothetical protein
MQKPEEIELDLKRTKLQELEDILANKELELVTTQAELLDFQKVYLGTVGRKIAELDEIEAKIAEKLAKKHPKDEFSKEKASETRKRADDSSYAYQFDAISEAPDRFSPSPSLKRLYRDVAKKIHPDLAVDEEDRSIREEFMKRANEAYKEGNEEKLMEILKEWESNPERVKGEGIGAELIRAIRKIDNIDKRIKIIQSEIEELVSSELYRLRQKVEEARFEQKDLLQEMVKHLDEKIKKKKLELQSLLST